MDKKSFCTLPWISMAIDVNGSVRPCCKFSQPNEHGAQALGNLRQQSVRDIWNGKEFQVLRKQFIAGEKPSSCKNCWDDEAAGISSFRQNIIGDYNIKIDDVDFSSLQADEPIVFDLKLSQKCNLKCRICGATASSTFLAEDKKLGRMIPKDEERYLSSYKILTDPEMTEWFRQVSKKAQHFEIFGGEPVLGQENREIEKILLESGRAKEMSLVYNTNATLFSEELVKSWSEFKSVVICLSIDDIGPRYEYQRAPGKWKNVLGVLENYRKFKTANMYLSLFSTVSIFNIYYLTEWLNWYQSDFPDFGFYFNILHTPEYFAVHSLPEEMKNAVLKKTQSETKRLAFKENIVVKLEEVMRFMTVTKTQSEVETSRAQEIKKRDLIRKQNFNSVFPEITQYISFSPNI